MKSAVVAYVIWLLGGCGVLGLHRFYLGRWITGLIWLFSLGLLGFGALVDLFLIPSMVQIENLASQLLGQAADARAMARDRSPGAAIA
jgi:TM2 domain-containing membrane protein YozV